MDERTARPDDPAWLSRAFDWDGLTEIVGGRHEREILKFFGDVGHSWVKDDETAWCAAFVGAMLERSGIRSTRQLNARSYTDWGEQVSVDDARRGDVAVFSRGDPNGWQGHVAFFLWATSERIWVLGGNQRNGVNVAAYPRDRLLSIRRHNADPSREYVKLIQSALADKGYHMVGKVDGIAGKNTRAAIRAFEDEHDLPVTGEITDRLLDQILTSEQREVAEERATGKPDESRILAKSKVGVAVGGGVLTLNSLDDLEAATEKVEQVKGFWQSAKALLHSIFPPEMLAALLPWAVAGGSLLLAYILWQIGQHRIEDHRKGKTP